MPADRTPATAGPFVMVGDDAASCVDGVCAVPPVTDRERPLPPAVPTELGHPA